jgi:outer membrane protein TolC
MKSRCLMTALVSVFLLSFLSISQAVTLERVLDGTLEKNPAIQQAKANLEQATGHRLVLRSIVWPSVRAGVPAGVQGGHRAGQKSTIVFAFARGSFTQPLFNAAIPPSLRLGDVDVLIAEQQLNLAVVEQLHAARLTFYSALYNRGLQSIRDDQRKRLDANAATQKDRYEAGLSDRGAFTSATVQARELDAQIEGASRAYAEARVKLAMALGDNLGDGAAIPEPEGELQSTPVIVDLEAETRTALERRADLKLARLLVRAANEQQRIVEAGYYPAVAGTILGDYIPVSGVHREGSTRRTEDFQGSEIREGGVYTWRVVDNGKVAGAALKQRKAKEINEVAVRKLESNIGGELSRIHNDLAAIEARQKSLGGALAIGEQNASMVRQNLLGGVVSELEYRLAENSFLDIKSGLLTACYQYNIAMAEWDRATGRYFQFSDDTAPNVH